MMVRPHWDVYLIYAYKNVPIPVVSRSSAWVFGRSLAGIFCSNPAGDWISVSFECCVSGWSPVQRSPTECGVSECDCEASIIRGPWDTGGCCTIRIYIKGWWVLLKFVVYSDGRIMTLRYIVLMWFNLAPLHVHVLVSYVLVFTTK